jgi:hypothetical protein
MRRVRQLLALRQEPFGTSWLRSSLGILGGVIVIKAFGLRFTPIGSLIVSVAIVLVVVTAVMVVFDRVRVWQAA